MTEKEEIKSCTCECGLFDKEVLTVQDRLVQLEDIVREIKFFHNISTFGATKEKRKLTADGKRFDNQQGILDTQDVIAHILEGETNFYVVTSDILEKTAKQQAAMTMEVG